MKKFKRFCLCFLMILVSCFCFSACGEEAPSTPAPAPTPEAPQQPAQPEPEPVKKNVINYFSESAELFDNALTQINGCFELENLTEFYAQSSNIGSQILTEILAKEAKLCGADAYFSTFQEMPENIKFDVVYYSSPSVPTDFAMLTKIAGSENIQFTLLKESPTTNAKELYQFDIIILNDSVSQIKFKCASCDENNLLTLYGSVIEANKVQFFYGKPSISSSLEESFEFLADGVSADKFDETQNWANFLYGEFNFSATTEDLIFSGKYEAHITSEQIGSTVGKAKTAFVNADFNNLALNYFSINNLSESKDPRNKRANETMFNLINGSSVVFDNENNTFERTN